MSTVEVIPGTPLAEALQNAVQPKLVEMGWSTGGLDDSALSEYIVLMLVNGQTQEQIATELSQDLLSLSADDNSAVGFAQWLFDQVDTLGRQLAGDGERKDSQQPVQGASSGTMADGAKNVQGSTGDVDMEEQSSSTANGSTMLVKSIRPGRTSTDMATLRPTGPKSMRDNARASGPGRMLGQLNKAMDRKPDGALHKIKGTAGTGRINSHAPNPPRGPTPRGPPPKGPTPKGPRAQINRAIPAIQPPVPVQNMPVTSITPGLPFTAMTPQQQMAVFKYYEDQARLMAQALTPQQQQQVMTSFPANMAPPTYPAPSPQAGKSLFERVEAAPRKTNGNYNNRPHQNGQSSLKPDAASFESSQTSAVAGPDSSMEVDTTTQPAAKPDPATTVCYFNLTCTKPDCYFVHQSPAAPPGTTIDMTDTCSFGAACKNRKCVGKHPSPSNLGQQRAQQDCKFYPNCTNPSCPFRHPTTKPCRNGADCAVENCPYSHNKTPCRYSPCLNPACPFKHVEGQKRGNFEDKVWINREDGGEDGQREHVSERRFVEDGAEEELIRPSETAMEAQTEAIIT